MYFSVFRHVEHQNDGLKKQNNDLQEKVASLQAQCTILLEEQTKLREEVSKRMSAGMNENFSATLFAPVEGFPLTTVENFEDMETDARAEDRKRLVSL